MFNINNFLPMTGFKLRISGIGSDHSTNWATTTSRLLLKLDTQPNIHLVFEFCTQRGIRTTPNLLQYGIPLPPSSMPFSMQEMASRCCHRSVCLVLTIEVYVSYISLFTFLVYLGDTYLLAFEPIRSINKSLRHNIWWRLGSYLWKNINITFAKL